MSRSSRIVWLAAAAVAALVVLVPASAASAKRQAIPASARHGNVLIFELDGIAPASVRSARLRMGKRTRSLRAGDVRVAAQCGTLRAREPKSWRRSPDSGNSERPKGHQPKLVVTTATSAPGTVTPPASDPQPPPSSPPTVPAGAKFVSPSGSDANPGTESAPWKTIAKAIRAARPGDTVVLGGGTYGARGTTTTADASGGASAPITFMGHPGEPRPTILGHFKITGNDLRFTGLLFDGPTGPVKPQTTENPKGEQVQVTINGDNVEISHSEIRGSDWHAGIYLSGAEGARIVGDYIHDNGDTDPCCYQFQQNASHGIYFSQGSGLIANNVIEHNLARGVQLYPSPANVLVTHNTIVGNGKAGVIVSNQAANNTIANNIVAQNADNSVRSNSLTGTGNLVINNLVWDNGHGNIGTMADGLSLVDNVEAEPGFTSSPDYHLGSGSAAIDGATGGYTVGEDYDDTARPLGAAPDIGAFEAC